MQKLAKKSRFAQKNAENFLKNCAKTKISTAVKN